LSALLLQVNTPYPVSHLALDQLYLIEDIILNLFVSEEMGKGSAYVAPDSHFISSVSQLANNLPWEKFKKFFNTKKLVNISADEHLILLRLLAMQELLFLDDESLLRWSRHQLYLFGFMQPSFSPKLPLNDLLVDFREGLDKKGLLKPFRKQCQKLLEEHEKSFPLLVTVDDDETVDVVFLSGDKEPRKIKIKSSESNLYVSKESTEVVCSNCGSENIFELKSSQEASSLPNIRFYRCQFCGNTFRN